MLAVQFDEMSGQLAQQTHANGLIIDEGFGAAIRLELAANDQSLANFNRDIRIVQSLSQSIRQAREFKTGGSRGLVRAAAH